MKRKQWFIGGCIGATLLGVGFGLQPLSDAYIGPYVQEKLHTALNGTVSYSSFHVDWDGSIQVQDISVDDDHGDRVLTADRMTISIQWLRVLQYPFGHVSPDALIGTVTMTTPHLNLVQNTEGQWNVLGLLKEQESEEPSQFSGLIRIDGGTLSLVVPHKNALVMTNIEATVRGDGGQTLESVVDGTLGSDTIHSVVNLGMGENRDQSFYVQTDHLTMAPILERLDVPESLKTTKGTLKDVALTISKRGGFWYGEGQLSLDDVSVPIPDYAITSGKGQVQMHGDVVFLQDMQADVKGDHLRVDGTVHHVFDEDPMLQLGVHLTEWNLASILASDVSGYASAEAMLTGPMSNVRGSADIHVHDVTYEGITVNRGEAHLAYGDGIIHMSDLKASLQGGKVEGTGDYDLEKGTYAGNLTLQGLSLYGLPMSGAPHLSGTISGSVSVEGNSAGISRMSGQVQGDRVQYESFGVDALEASIVWDGSRVTIPYLNGNIGSGAVTGHGYVENNQFSVDLHGTKLELHELIPESQPAVKGTISLQLHGEGALDNPTGTATVEGASLGYGATQFERGFLQAELKDHALHIMDGYLGYRKSRYTLEGHIGLDDVTDMDVRAKAQDVRIEDIMPAVADIPVTGWLNTELRLQGTWKDPVLHGHLKAWDGSIYGKLYESIEGEYSYEGDTLFLPRLEMHTYGGTIVADGQVSKEHVDVNFSGDDLPVEPFIRDTGVDLKGYITTRGHLGGTLDLPIFEGTVLAPEMHSKDSVLQDVMGSVYITPNIVNLQELSFTGTGNSRYDIKGGVQLTGEKRLFGYVHVEDGDVHQLLSLGNVQIPDLNGKLRGTIDLGGTSDDPRIEVKGSIADVAVRNKVVGTATIDAAYGGRTVDIHTFTLPIQQGLIAAKGKADLDGSTDIQVVASKVPVATLLPLVTQDMQGSGDWNFIINVNGQTKSPKVEFSSEVEHAVVNGIGLDQLSLLGTMEDHVLRIQQGMIKKADSSIKLRGNMPVSAFVTSDYITTDTAKQFDMYVDMNEANLSVLPLMFREVTAADGDIRGIVHVTGTVDNILTNGNVELKAGTLQVKSLRKPFEDLKGQLLFRGNHVDIVGSTTMGKGNAGISGNIGWMGSKITSYYGALQMKGLDVVHPFYTGPLDGELYMVNRQELPTLVGAISLHDVVGSIPLSFESSTTSIPLGLDVTVDAKENVRLYNPLLYDMNLQGKVKFEGTVSEPKASGHLDVRKGYVKYLKNRFKITEGQAKFVTGSIIPELDVRSTANVKNYRVSLHANGPATHMQLKLSAEPNLSERQIISLLTFGRNVGNNSGVTSDDANALITSSLQSLAFGYIEDILQDALGLDMVNITTGSLDGKDDRDMQEKNNFNVTIGKYVVPDLMVTLTRGLKNDHVSYGFQYDINRNISATGWFNNDNKRYLGAQWRYRF